MDLPELLAIFGPGISGAVFGAGWWFWVDAVVCSSVKVPFVHYLPGICCELCLKIIKFFGYNLFFTQYVFRDFCIVLCVDVQLREERGYWLLAVWRGWMEVNISSVFFLNFSVLVNFRWIMVFPGSIFLLERRNRQKIYICDE